MLLLVYFGAIALALVVLWYYVCARHSKRRALEALRWVEQVLGGHGRVVGMHWRSPSRLCAQLRFSPSVFSQAAVVVQLEPREMPLAWLAARLQHQQEVVTFEADLEMAPEFSLELQNRRWCGRTSPSRLAPPEGWELHRALPFMITTRREWQHEVCGMMDTLVASRQRDFLSISYRRTSPHLAVRLPLDALAPATRTCSGLFDVLRELAGGASAARF